MYTNFLILFFQLTCVSQFYPSLVSIYMLYASTSLFSFVLKINVCVGLFCLFVRFFFILLVNKWLLPEHSFTIVVLPRNQQNDKHYQRQGKQSSEGGRVGTVVECFKNNPSKKEYIMKPSGFKQQWGARRGGTEKGWRTMLDRKNVFFPSLRSRALRVRLHVAAATQHKSWEKIIQVREFVFPFCALLLWLPGAPRQNGGPSFCLP